MSERVMPTEPGLWWVRMHGSPTDTTRWVGECGARPAYNQPAGLGCWEDDGESVTYSGYDWIAPVTPHAEVVALRERVAALERERDELRAEIDAHRWLLDAIGSGRWAAERSFDGRVRWSHSGEQHAVVYAHEDVAAMVMLMREIEATRPVTP